MYTYKIWDKKSPINGISAEMVIESHKINPAGEVGLILDERGGVCVLQYDNGRPYTVDEVTAVIEKVADEMNNPPAPAVEESD